MVGASIGFLWYNAHPAEIFMGDDSDELSENPVFKHYVAEVESPRSYVVEFYVHHFFRRRSSPGSNTWKRTE